MVQHIYQKDIDKIDIPKKVGKFVASRYSKMELSSLSQVL